MANFNSLFYEELHEKLSWYKEQREKELQEKRKRQFQTAMDGCEPLIMPLKEIKYQRAHRQRMFRKSRAKHLKQKSLLDYFPFNKSKKSKKLKGKK
jgi:hypothetical protein